MYIKTIGKDMESFRNQKVILFGCGSCGLRSLEEFEKVGATILGFCDNNPELAGKIIHEYPVIPPNKLNEYQNTDIIITSTYEKEIENQLLNKGIKNFYHVKVGVLKEKLEKDLFRNKVISNDMANQIILEGLTADKPFFVGRLGSVELECLSQYLYLLKRKTLKAKEYPQNVKMMMNINAGFFPTEDPLLDRFSELYLENLQDLDLIWSMWFSKFEDMIYHDFYREKIIADYDNTVFPIDQKYPWTEGLRGKKVLVIHPFSQSIEENYKIKDKLFDNKNFMPDFHLITLKAVQSIANSVTPYSTWFEALDDMKRQIDQMDFDIALIGAGAYGLALGTHVKNIGKKAVHIGGMLQLYFGIKGKAWNKLNIYNNYWTSPRLEETPSGYKNVEAGRYW